MLNVIHNMVLYYLKTLLQKELRQLYAIQLSEKRRKSYGRTRKLLGLGTSTKQSQTHP